MCIRNTHTLQNILTFYIYHTYVMYVDTYVVCCDVVWADQKVKCANIRAICTVSMQLAIAHFVIVIEISHLHQSITIATYKS